jgi:hypothetical protein
MFVMGEEIVAQKSVRYDNIDQSKEDLHGERAGADTHTLIPLRKT